MQSFCWKKATIRYVRPYTIWLPYIKGKGVKDLYLIRVARIGNKAEINKGSKDYEPRLVFELDFLDSLPEYKPVKLNIFNAFRDTVLGSIL